MNSKKTAMDVTMRQRQAHRLRQQGHTSRQIADMVGVVPRVIERYLSKPPPPPLPGLVLPAEPACIGNPDPFYPDESGSAACREAKAICATCPARVACLEWALAHDERYGVWGGTSPDERDQLRRKARA